MGADDFSPWAQPWMREASCAHTDPDEWFPDVGGSSVIAKRICSMCPVRVDCLEYAVVKGEPHGIWGGLSARERYAIRAKLGYLDE